MTRTGGVIAFLLGAYGGIVACGGAMEEIPMATLINDGLSNQVGAYAKYHDEWVRTSGQVEQIGIGKTRGAVATHVAWKSTVSPRDIPYVFVYLRDDAQPGRVVCYFRDSEADEVAKLVAGTSASVKCKFQEFSYPQPGQVDVVLNRCRLD